MHKRRIGVLRGGLGSEYEISLQTGKAVLDNLKEEKYISVDIVVHQDGIWHIGGIPQKPEQAFSKIDLLFIALHGHYGEDGKLQRFLDIHGVPYTGSGALSSAISMHKHLAKDCFKKFNIKTPLFVLVRSEEDVEIRARDIWRHFPHPVIVKPASAGSSIGVAFVTTYDELVEAILVARFFSDSVIIEEYIQGREVTCGVFENFRGQQTYALPPVEVIVSPDKKIYDYDSKYINVCRTICPGRFSNQEKHEIQETAKRVQELLPLRHYACFDFIVSPQKGLYVLEVNTLPGLASESLFQKSLEAVGVTMPQFLDHIISLTEQL